MSYTIAGVFQNNPVSSVIIGSLWTLKYEVAFYLLIGCLFFFREKRRWIKLLHVMLFLVLFSARMIYRNSDFIMVQPTLIENLTNFGYYFVCGSLMAVFGFDKLKHLDKIAAISILMIVVTSCLDCLRITFPILFPLMVIASGLLSWKWFEKIGRLGDISYGLYLFSFPIQQALYHYLRLTDSEMIIYSLLLSSGLAYLSWHFVESKALSLKRSISSVPKS